MPPWVKQPHGVDGSDVEVAVQDLWVEFFRSSPAMAFPIVPYQSLAAVSAPTYTVKHNDDVLRFLEHFQTGDRRAVVARWLTRSGRYLPMILGVFKQKGLPEELVFTAMIESGFNPIAVSRAGAKGLWQFMAPTARRYGLKVDRWLDERLDPEKSTVAAANYLRDLYTMFGSWDLVQAAYNAGEMTVARAIRGTGTSDFWALTQGRLLKQETKDFVPAIHAATLIGREPERYGFAVTPEEPLRYEQVPVPKATSLTRIAASSGVPLEDLERLNPELRLKQTPPDGSYALKVPLGSTSVIQAGLEREPAASQAAVQRRTIERSKRKAPAAHAAAARVHVVQPRETVSTIAKRYGVSAAELSRWNNLDKAGRIAPGDRLRIVSRAPHKEGADEGGFR